VVTTRAARREDAGALGEVHVTTWRSAYAGLLPQALLDGLSAQASAARWRGLLPCSPPLVALVAVDPADRPTGFAFAGPYRDDADPGTAELYSLYVHPDHAGTGAGTALLQQTRNHLQTAGFTRARLWVLTTNQHARGFYERRDWTADARTRIATRDGTEVHESRLSCDLASPPT